MVSPSTERPRWGLNNSMTAHLPRIVGGKIIEWLVMMFKGCGFETQCPDLLNEDLCLNLLLKCMLIEIVSPHPYNLIICNMAAEAFDYIYI